MFGFVVANRDTLSAESLTRYRAYYCGLCKALSERAGYTGRMTLTYDMTFLTMFLGSMYETPEQESFLRCLPHPVIPHSSRKNGFTTYAADLNLYLTYYKCLDDWKDDRNVLKLGASKLLEKHLRNIPAQYPRQCAKIESCLDALSAAEASKAGADACTNLFAELLGELFVYDPEDHFSDTIRSFGEALGRFIYLSDAYIDRDEDQRKHRYNPFIDQPELYPRAEDLLKGFLGEAAAAFEALPLTTDSEILRNILYSGVWTRFYMYQGKKQKDRPNT